jgi:protein SCO1/2
MRVFLTLLIALAAITVGYFMLTPKPKNHELEVINPVDVASEMVDSSLMRTGFGHRIGNFSFLNQYGEKVTLADVENKVFVAEYFFTTCGTICPRMNVQMQRVQQAFKKNTDVSILSFTVDPETDTVAQMKMYAEGHGAIRGKWHFLTGEEKDLYALARKSFFVLKPAEVENQGDAGSDFIHTNNFVLVDKQLRIRGYYDGTSEKEVDDLIRDIAILLEEKSDK